MKTEWIAVTLFAATGALAQTVEIERAPLGSGQPGESGFEAAVAVTEGLYHVPQYLPGYPTAAVIWPRAIRIQCRENAGVLRCEGYRWSPAMGRAEYLYFVPVIVTGPAPQ